MKTVYLSDFDVIRPEFQGNQSDSIEKLVDLRMKFNPALNRTEVTERIMKYGLANSKIETRSTDLPDFLNPESDLNDELRIFSGDQVASLSTRMAFFKKKAQEVFFKWYHPQKVKNKPAHIVHVTCTGYIAPNAAHGVVSKWAEEQTGSHTQVTNAYHMGCYASLPAIRIAKGLCFSGNGDTQVDIAHNEICTLHFDPITLAAEQIVVQSLFADGHIKYSMQSKRPALGFEVCQLNEITLPASMDLMTWVPGTNQFTMTLSREVPMHVAPLLQPFVEKLIKAANLESSTPIYYAIHPGGPKIIEGVEMMLGLEESQTTESHEILRTCGNMSSATLPHIWNLILQNKSRVNGGAVVSLGFGPGLTMSGAVFKICRS